MARMPNLRSIKMKYAYKIAYSHLRAHRSGRMKWRDLRRLYNTFKRLGCVRAWEAADLALWQSQKTDLYEVQVIDLIPF